MEYAAEPPPGVTPDYDNPARNGVCRLFVVIPLLMALATIMVALRLYTRKFIVKNVGLDDCMWSMLRPLTDFELTWNQLSSSSAW